MLVGGRKGRERGKDRRREEKKRRQEERDG